MARTVPYDIERARTLAAVVEMLYGAGPPCTAQAAHAGDGCPGALPGRTKQPVLANQGMCAPLTRESAATISLEHCGLLQQLLNA